jgi:hypothetical protein
LCVLLGVAGVAGVLVVVVWWVCFLGTVQGRESYWFVFCVCCLWVKSSAY